jgi:hypothetical protein
LLSKYKTLSINADGIKMVGKKIALIPILESIEALRGPQFAYLAGTQSPVMLELVNLIRMTDLYRVANHYPMVERKRSAGGDEVNGYLSVLKIRCYEGRFNSVDTEEIEGTARAGFRCAEGKQAGADNPYQIIRESGWGMK